MPKQEGQKSKLVTLLRILEQRTDENHRLNVPQLVQLLENQGILAERKSIYSDIDTLRSLGYDIQLQRGRGGGYWMASRAFELSELKLLVDAVQSSSVISARTSKRIIHKLEALCSDYEGTQLQRQVYVDGRPKTDSQTLLYSIDALHTAINRGCLVQFRYKGSSAVRTVSPWQLAWENGCYYLIAYQDEKAPPVRHYRVDRMAGVLVLDEPRRGKEFFRTFDLPAYLRKHFNMFGGTEYRVTLRCAADLEPVMRERFGREPVFCPEDAEHFHFDVPICVSQQFFGWVCGFGGKALAEKVLEIMEDRPIQFTYPLDMPLKDKVKAIAKKIYRADDVNFSAAASKTLAELTELGYGDLPVCIAKTQYSFSDNAKLLAAPTGFTMEVREVRLAAGAGFIVVICGNIMTMPGLPKKPAAVNIDVDADGKITGLF